MQKEILQQRIEQRLSNYLSEKKGREKRYVDWLQEMEIITSTLRSNDLAPRLITEILNSENITDFEGHPFTQGSIRKLINDLNALPSNNYKVKL